MSSKTRWLVLVLLAAAAVCLHGYHLGTDDSAIYVPAIKHVADPQLYPFGSEFFTNHGRNSLLPIVVGGLARLTHVPVDWMILACHFTGVLLLLLAAWETSTLCFEREPARWAAVVTLALTLCVPVAGTALVIMDPYVTARTLSTPAVLFAIASQLRARTGRMCVWLTVAFVLHPQMAVYGAALVITIALMKRESAITLRVRSAIAYVAEAALLPWPLDPPSGTAGAVLASRRYFFVNTWEWYEWVGVLAPLALLYWFGQMKIRGMSERVAYLTRSLVAYGIAATIGAIALSETPALANYTRLQPMRAFHIMYVLLFLLLGGYLGEYLLRKSTLRWVAFVAPLCVGMFAVARCGYPHSAHIELPGNRPQNKWVDAFLWVREHTPKDAVFAIDPDYMATPMDDEHGFRAVAERSVLADRLKDSGAVSLFPQLAPEWKREVDANEEVRNLSPGAIESLTRAYPISWIITRPQGAGGLTCPYANEAVAVCQVGTEQR